MPDQNVTALQEAIQKRWPPQAHADSPKVKRYVGKFWDRKRRERKITAVVKGNHGDYTVSIEAQEGGGGRLAAATKASTATAITVLPWG